MRWMIFAFAVVVAGCNSQQQKVAVPLGNQNYSAEPVGVYLVPVWGVDKKVLQYLESTLARQHKVRVKRTTFMGLDEHHFDNKHKQFVGEEIVKSSFEIARSLRKSGKKTPILVIIPGDMNSQEFRFRYLFSQHFVDHKITVISLARINPASYGLPPDPDLTGTRALKLANKALGFHMYGYMPSSNTGNVMYGPIMGLDDLDKVNTWYR